MYVPLHIASEYSFGYGTAPVEQLVALAAGYGLPAMALTDIENLYGQVRFHCAARASGIRPITGVELRRGFARGTLGDRSGRLILLARDREGYRSLCRLVSRRRSSPAPTPHPLQSLDGSERGLFYLSDDGAVLRALQRRGISPADLKLLERPGPKAPSSAPGIEAVPDPEVVMARPEDHDLHRLLVAARTGRRFDTVVGAESRARFLPRRVDASRTALNQTLRLAETCDLDLCGGEPVFPEPRIPSGSTPLVHLSRRCRDRLGGADPEYRQRLEKELGVIELLGLAPYLLVVAEIAQEARRRGIEVAGRGSAAGSLVAFLTGVTGVDPIRHQLQFERFIHTGRSSLPDIDLDVASSRREELIGWVYRRFGAHRVAMVSTHVRYGRRSAFREGLKAFGMTASRVDRFCQRLPPEELEAEIPWALPLDLLDSRLRASVPLIERMVGRPNHLSVHPGGMVITPTAMVDHVAVERAAKGVMVTQYDKRSVARLGLVKFDLLGNRALAAFQEVEQRAGAGIASPDGDPATLATLQAADTVGCFQVETPPMRSTLRRFPVSGIEDLATVLALVRPGPGAGAAKTRFIRRVHGEEESRPPHPRLGEVLRRTHGMLLFEEDVTRSIAELTGCSLAQADGFRAEMTEADEHSTRLAELREGFSRAAEGSGLSHQEVGQVWRVLERFAAYAFNKAHAVSYAALAWRSVYLRTHRPVEYACAVLNHYGGHYPLRTIAAAFQRAGVRVLLPHVNRSEWPCTVEGGAVRVGLGLLRHLTAGSRQRILRSRPFTRLADLFSRGRLRPREAEVLLLSGACDELIEPEALPPEGMAETRQRLIRVRNELNTFGMHLSFHPLAVLRAEAARAGAISVSALPDHEGREVSIAALVAATRRVLTRPGEIMQFVTFEDETGLVEAVLFPQLYAWLGDPITNPGPFLATGRVRVDHGDVLLELTAVLPFHERDRPYSSDRAG